MTLRLFKNRMQIESDDFQELLSIVEDAYNNSTINTLEYAQIKSDINMKYRQPAQIVANTNRRQYTMDEVMTVLKSHLDVYDGIKDVSAHLNLMKQLFGEASSQFRNGAQYNRNFHRMLDEGAANLGQSMPANWADGTLEIIQDRPVQFKNVLDACQKIYDSTDNGNMSRVIQRWQHNL